MLLVGSVAFRIASAGAYRLTREKIACVTAYLQETLSGVRIVRAFGQEPRHRERFAELNDENREANMRTVYLNAAYFPAVELLSAVATGGDPALRRQPGARRRGVTIGVLASFVFYLQSFFDPIQQLSQLYTTYQAGMAALDKIFELLDEEPDLQRRPDARRAAADARRDRLRGRDLLLRRQRRLALCDVVAARAARPDAWRWSAPPAPASRRSPSSSRASTTPTDGRVLIDGHDLRDVTERSLRSQLGRRAAGELPVLGHDPRQHRVRAPGRRADARSRRPPAPSARTSSSSGCPTATTPRSASAAASCRPASASWSPSPAPRRPTRAS